MSSFLELVDRAQALLEARGRVSLRALGRELSLDDDSLEDLAEELVDVQQVATRDGKVLTWRGAGAEPPTTAAADPKPAAPARSSAPTQVASAEVSSADPSSAVAAADCSAALLPAILSR